MTQRLDFDQSLKAAKAELVVLQEELGECLATQEQLEKRIVAVRVMIGGLSNALNQTFDEADELGLTDAVRQAFKTNSTPLEPTALRTRLQQLGFNTKKYGNFMASLHTIISRLAQSGEIKQQQIPGNKIGYVWAKPTPPPTPPPSITDLPRPR
jgi:hypothetical protein